MQNGRTRNRQIGRVATALSGLAAGTVVATLVHATPAAAQVTAAVPCESLAGLTLPDTKITLAQSVTGGSFTPPNPAFATMTDLPDFCRVAGTLTPTPDSAINFEVWLPLTNWNGHYQQQGNGGFAGLIRYGYMLVPLRRNFVVANTDDGNQDLSSSGAFAVGHPQKVIDFGYRAVHLTAQVAKAITEVQASSTFRTAR